MFKYFENFFSTLSPINIGIFTIILIVVISLLDYFIGYELSFSIFYLFPVALSRWYVGQKFGYAICFLSAVTWLGVDYASSHQYQNMIIPLWNGFVRLGFFVIVVTLLGRLRSAFEYQEALAELDGLTGILNGRAFRHRCEILFRLFARNNRPLTLAYIDLDGFKRINDSLGHSVGDEVLRGVAEIIKQRVRASDICARLGGDEFSILLPETDYAGAQVFFNGLHCSLIEFAELHHWSVGFSIGVAVFQSPKSNLEQAIKLADGLMYDVKNSGKNNVRYQEFDIKKHIN